jgi:DNA-directed RNA polymerase subunit RPC12/RpoP
MFKVFNYRCPKCGDEVEKLTTVPNMDKQRCLSCNTKLLRLPPATRTHFRFADTKLKR